MESVDAKMIRAHEHLETLRRELNEYLATIKIEQVLKTDPAQPHPWLVIWASDYIPPIRLSVLLGDCVHNMRSALDNLICGLAKTVDRCFECEGALGIVSVVAFVMMSSFVCVTPTAGAKKARLAADYSGAVIGFWGQPSGGTEKRH